MILSLIFIFNPMKKLFLHNPGMIILSITLFLLTESSWLIYWFRIEEKNFRNDINQAIHAAIQEEAYRINEEDDSFVDFRIENRIIWSILFGDNISE